MCAKIWMRWSTTTILNWRFYLFVNLVPLEIVDAFGFDKQQAVVKQIHLHISWFSRSRPFPFQWPFHDHLACLNIQAQVLAHRPLLIRIQDLHFFFSSLPHVAHTHTHIPWIAHPPWWVLCRRVFLLGVARRICFPFCPSHDWHRLETRKWHSWLWESTPDLDGQQGYAWGSLEVANCIGPNAWLALSSKHSIPACVIVVIFL